VNLATQTVADAAGAARTEFVNQLREIHQLRAP